MPPDRSPDPSKNAADALPRRPWQPRFGLGGMMLVMLIFCVMGAATSYFVQSTKLGRSYQAAFIAVTLVSPLLLLVLVSSLHAVMNRRRR